MLAADVLVTDYSSMMFDFANTGRPMLFFTYDLDTYRDEVRGFYFDFLERAPGPAAAHERRAGRGAARPRRRARRSTPSATRTFVAEFCELDDGGPLGGWWTASSLRNKVRGDRSRRTLGSSVHTARGRGPGWLRRSAPTIEEVARGGRPRARGGAARATSPCACRRAGATSSATAGGASTSSSSMNARMAKELRALARVIGRDGRMTERAALPGALRRAGPTAIEAVNSLIDDLVRPTTEVARVIAAVAAGRPDPEDGADDRGPAGQGRVPPHRHDRERDGRPARRSFADEVTRVAREVGTEGKLGGQAEVKGVVGHVAGPDRLGERRWRRT